MTDGHALETDHVVVLGGQQRAECLHRFVENRIRLSASARASGLQQSNAESPSPLVGEGWGEGAESTVAIR